MIRLVRAKLGYCFLYVLFLFLGGLTEVEHLKNKLKEYVLIHAFFSKMDLTVQPTTPSDSQCHGPSPC